MILVSIKMSYVCGDAERATMISRRGLGHDMVQPIYQKVDQTLNFLVHFFDTLFGTRVTT